MNMTTVNGYSFNGPICPQCGMGYIGSHQCDPADLRRQAMALLRHADAIDASKIPAPTAPIVWPMQTDRTTGCPCRPENGGPGVCGCVLGGQTVTCASGQD